MNPVLILVLILVAIGLVPRERTLVIEAPEMPPGNGASDDVHLYRGELDAQLDRLVSLDTMLSAVAAIAFAGMTYLLQTDGVSKHALERWMALTLITPVATTLFAMIAYRPSNAPDLIEFDQDLRENRAAAIAKAKTAMIEAYRDNAGTLVAKTRFLVASAALAAVLFLVVLSEAVVR